MFANSAVARRKGSSRFHAPVERLEPRFLLSGQVYVNGQTYYGAGESASPVEINQGIAGQQTWTLTLSNLPGHTQVTDGVFAVRVTDAGSSGGGDSGGGDSGGGDSGDGGCDSGGCDSGGCDSGGCDSGGGDSGGGGANWSFTLSVEGHETTVQDQNDGNDTILLAADLPFSHTADTLTATISPSGLPSDAQWEVTSGEVDVTTYVGVYWEQDANCSGQVPGVARFVRDAGNDQPLDVYYGLGGSTAQFGVQTGSDDQGNPTFDPPNADFYAADNNGPQPVPDQAGLFVVTIPAGASSVDVEFTPVVPDVFPEGTDKTIIPTIGDPLAAQGVIPYNYGAGTALPATQKGFQKKFTVIDPAVTDANKSKIQLDIATLNDDNADQEEYDDATNDLNGVASGSPSPSMYDYLTQQANDPNNSERAADALKATTASVFPLASYITFNGDNTITVAGNNGSFEPAGSRYSVSLIWSGGGTLTPAQGDTSWNTSQAGYISQQNAQGTGWAGGTLTIYKNSIGDFNVIIQITETDAAGNITFTQQRLHLEVVPTASLQQ